MTTTPFSMKLAGLAAFIALCVGVLAYLFQTAGGQIRFSAPYRFTALMSDVANLVPDSDVREAGVKVGQIDSLKPNGTLTAVGIELDQAAAPVYRDARVLLETKTLVGENYVSLDAGHSSAGALPSGAQLPLSHTDEAVQLDQIFTSLDPATRRRIQADLRELGIGLAGRGQDLNQLFSSTAGTATAGTRVLDIFDAQRAALARVISNGATALDAIASRRDALRQLALAGQTAATAAEARDASLRQTIAELPSALTRTQRTVAALRRLSLTGTPVLSQLEAGVTALTPAVRVLGPTTVALEPSARQLVPFVRSLTTLALRLGTFGRIALPGVSALGPLLRQVDPLLSYLDPYVREIGAAVANVGAFAGGSDSYGHEARVQALFDQSTLDTVPPSLRQAMNALIASGAIAILRNTHSNAYPKPGAVGNPQPFTSAYPHVGGGR
jgi:phospholipid/cholesterol/gamma-HCH transport system substrate-binding protein